MKILILLLESLFTLIVLLYVWRFLNWAYIKPKRLERFLRKQGFKGNKYRFLHGDLKELKQEFENGRAKSINIDDDIKPKVAGFLLKTIQTYGKDSFFCDGTRLTVIINDPELAREVLSKMQVFEKPHDFINPSSKRLFRGLVSYKGDKWSKHRKILNPAFHLEKLKLLVPAFKLSCEEVLSNWEQYILSSDGSGEIDVWPHVQRIARDAISRTAFGSNYEEGRRIFELQREQSIYVIKDAQSIYVPGTRFLPTKKNKRMKKIESEAQSFIRGMIRRRMDEMKSGEPTNNDLLALLLESNTQEIEHGNRSFGMSMEEVVDECILFYIAGQETTSTLILWTMVLLSRYQEWQHKAREEVSRVFGNQTPHYEGLSQLHIVNMILHEVLRLYPPTVTLVRRVNKEIKLGEMMLPADINAQIPVIFLHHDTEIWGEDAMKFNPERFSEGVSKAMKKSGLFCPFGGGPRICIAQNFALMEAKVAISMFLQRFSSELSSSYAHAPVSMATIQPQHGAHLILHKL